MWNFSTIIIKKISKEKIMVASLGKAMELPAIGSDQYFINQIMNTHLFQVHGMSPVD
jgi:hypothetical protein